MALIPQSFIDDLVARIDIVDLINSRVPLKKAGREFGACCPFHDEKSPSFTVSPEKQFYHCFGCGAHGTAVGFMMEYDRLEFPDAVRALAEYAGVEVPVDEHGPDEQQRERNRQLYKALERADAWFRQQLSHANTAVSYLKARGLSGQIAKTYGIGYAPDAWDKLSQQFGDSQAKRQALVEAGLLAERDNEATNSPRRHYDRFRNRITFPIRDTRGRVIGFGARVLDDSKPKYLNSPETPLFHKGKQLYGLYEALQAKERPSQLFIVEGYMDVIALAQHGINNAVATLGTATTPEHLKLLFRYVDDIVFCFDGDRAGRKAAWRALEHALPLARDGRQLRFLFAPEGDDPDSLVRKLGEAGFREELQQATPLSQFLLESLSQQVDTSNIDGRARLIELAKPLLQQLPSGAFRSMLEHELALLSKLPPDHISGLIKEGQEPNSQPRNPEKKITPQAKQPNLIRELITLLLQQPKLVQALQNPAEIARYNTPGTPFIMELIDFLQSAPHIAAAGVLEHFRDRPEHKRLTELAMRELPGDIAGLEQAIRDCELQIRSRIRQQQVAELMAKKSQQGLNTAETETLRQLLSRK